jgi:mono/diheme cytochrome c family protein
LNAAIVVGFLAGALLCGRQSRSPLPDVVHAAPASAVERGQAVYRRHGCGFCHGQPGASGESCEGTGKAPPVTSVADGRTAAQLRLRIRDGVRIPGRVDFKNRPIYSMPAFGAQLTERQLSDLAAYLISLRPPRPSAAAGR